MKTIEEVISITGLSRRQIQEFQRYGLADRPKQKNKYGHFEYNDSDIARLWELRFYKELGYDAPRITQLECELYEDRQRRLDLLISELEEKQKKLNQLINVAKTMRSAGVNVSAISKIYGPVTEMNFNDFLSIAAQGLYPDLQVDYSKIEGELLNQDDEEALCSAIDMIGEGLFDESSPDDNKVESGFALLYQMWIKVLPDSIDAFQTMLHMMAENYEFIKDITETFGAGSIEKILKALDVFCAHHGMTELDREYERSLAELPQLRRDEFVPESDEVQEKIAVLHRVYRDIKLIDAKESLKALERFGQTYVTAAEESSNILPVEKDDAIYLQTAIKFYIKKNQEENYG